MKQSAIILGATGLVGRTLLDMLLTEDTYETVKVFGRSTTGRSHPKMEEHLGDLFDMTQFSDTFTGDVVFCCIGTTKAKTPDKETYRKIDHGIPVAAATLSRTNNIPMFQVISALGSNPSSGTFYNKVKGEMERDVIEQKVQETYILQPSLIGGDRDENRIGERMAQWGMKVFGFLVPKKYKMIEPETIAKAMITIAAEGYKKTRIPSDEIKEIAST